MSIKTCWWATCEGCGTNVAVAPHPDEPKDIPHPEEWDGPFADDCRVCGDTLHWNSDPAGTVTL